MCIQKLLLRLLLPLWLLACLSCTSLVTPDIKTDLTTLREGAYQLDPRHTALLFKVNHMGFSSFVGRFGEVQASLDFDPENIANSRLLAIVHMASVNVNDESFEKTLRSGAWFNVETFPEAVFQTVSAQRMHDNIVQFNGDLTFLGVTRPVNLVVTFNGGANNMLSGRYTIGFEAEAVIKRSEFGLKKYVPLVGDEVELEVYAEFQRQ